MILKALRHNTEDDIAQALNVDVAIVRKKRNLLNGVCPEAADVLKASRVAPGVFVNLRKMKPVRQVEAAELMAAANNFTARFAQALLMGTIDDLRVEPQRQDRRYLSPTQRAHLAHETEALLRKAKTVEASYGTNLLTLSVCLRYVDSVISNQTARSFLDARYPELLRNSKRWEHLGNMVRRLTIMLESRIDAGLEKRIIPLHSVIRRSGGPLATERLGIGVR